MKNINIGLLGLGTIGTGVAGVLLSKADKLTEQTGIPLVLQKILVHDVNKQRSIKLEPHMLTNHAEDVINNPEINMIIEVMGGEHPALEYIKQAISNGKHVVTANKEVIAKYGYELLSLARKHHVDIRYEASVGGGIPLISPFQQDLAANDISAIYAILNGTTNYILTQMSQQGLDFASALKRAQELGYAETNPTNDIEGIDAAYKLAILSGLAFHTNVNPGDIYREGISRLQTKDFRYAKEFGYAIKLLAIAKRDGETIELRVHPVFIPEDSQLAKVDDVYNAIQVEGNLTGKLIFYGQGAGALPTSSAIMADVLAIARNIYHGRSNTSKIELEQKLQIKPMADLKIHYYFRLTVIDRPGVLSKISTVLGNNSIGISSVIQKESNSKSQTAVLVIMTHIAEEKAVQRALQEIKELKVVKEISNFIRVEE